MLINKDNDKIGDADGGDLPNTTSDISKSINQII